MRLDQLPGDVHLTYCTNIHAGETWSEVRSSLASHIPQIKRQVSPDRPMGIGLRLSAVAAEELAASAALAEFQRFLTAHNSYVFTINAFPYGPFHGRPVKEDVYQPDWRTPERLRYSNCVAEILAVLLPASIVGSISTVPGTFNPLATANAVRQMVANIELAMRQRSLESPRSGPEIVLALEAEPCCYLEAVDETVAFFRDHLHTDENASELAALTGLDRNDAAAALRRHIGVCYDICHGALCNTKSPRQRSRVLRKLAFAWPNCSSVPPCKSRTWVRRPATNSPRLTMASTCIKSCSGKTERSLALFDLAPAFEALEKRQADGEWRVHCHVPIFLSAAGPFDSTQETLRRALACVRSGFVAPHLEVETYTWTCFQTCFANTAAPMPSRVK